MFRTILFLVLVGLAAFAATVLAEQQGDVALVWHGLRYSTSIPKFAAMFGTVLVLAMSLWAIIVGAWRLPARMRVRLLPSSRLCLRLRRQPILAPTPCSLSPLRSSYSTSARCRVSYLRMNARRSPLLSAAA